MTHCFTITCFSVLQISLWVIVKANDNSTPNMFHLFTLSFLPTCSCCVHELITARHGSSKEVYSGIQHNAHLLYKEYLFHFFSNLCTFCTDFCNSAAVLAFLQPFFKTVFIYLEIKGKISYITFRVGLIGT